MPPSNQTVNPPNETRDNVRANFYELIQEDDMEFEDLLGISPDKLDISLRAARAMKHATGHESISLFRFGYMLYIVLTHDNFTLDDLRNVAARDWNLQGEDSTDADLPDKVRDMTFFPCYLAVSISYDRVSRYFEENLNPHATPAGVRLFLNECDQDENGDIPHDRMIPCPAIIVAVLCAEIWCAWASRSRSSLPSKQEFMSLFPPEAKIGIHVKSLLTRLTMISNDPVWWEHLNLFHGQCI
ncbi:hypothetical protein F4808DRAFT_254559 [Astrocystis sublimbata]|nr:hypothetical protein F4808DRAFT_254559 [Astrocystis sublimbata]